MEQPRDTAGRYDHKAKCDACGRRAGDDHYTDELVCGNGDGPGFYVCGRCYTKLADRCSTEERRAIYTAGRANAAAKNARRKAGL